MVEATGHQPRRQRHTATGADVSAPRYLNFNYTRADDELILELQIRTGLIGEPLKDVLFFAVGLALYGLARYEPIKPQEDRNA